MEKSVHQTLDYFSVYQTIFQTLSSLYLEEPEYKFIQDLFKKNIIKNWPVISSDSSYQNSQNLLQNYLKNFSKKHFEGLVEDYYRLFVGFESMLAPPYESVYLSDDHILFDPITLTVRRCYQKYDLTIDSPDHLPDDHLGYELDFLSILCGKTVEKPEIFEELKKDLQSFLNNHLQKWLDPFTERVLSQANSDYFKGIAFLTKFSVGAFDSFLKKETYPTIQS